MIFDLPTSPAPEVSHAVIRLTASDGTTIEHPCALNRRSIDVPIPAASDALRIEYVPKAIDGSDWTPVYLGEIRSKQTTCSPVIAPKHFRSALALLVHKVLYAAN